MKNVRLDRELNEMVKETPIVAVMQELEKALVANDAPPETFADEVRRAA